MDLYKRKEIVRDYMSRKEKKKHISYLKNLYNQMIISKIFV